MEKTVTITKIRLDLLKYFEECKEYDADNFFIGEYSSDELEETFNWLLHSKYLSNCGSLKYKLNDKGLGILKQTEKKIEDQNKNILKVENNKWWDRFIQNGQYILNSIFGGGLLFFAYLTYNQADKNKSITELQELRIKDSLKFSTTLDSLQNQLTQQNKQLQNIRVYIQKDSLEK